MVLFDGFCFLNFTVSSVTSKKAGFKCFKHSRRAPNLRWSWPSVNQTSTNPKFCTRTHVKFCPPEPTLPEFPTKKNGWSKQSYRERRDRKTAICHPVSILYSPSRILQDHSSNVSFIRGISCQQWSPGRQLKVKKTIYFLVNWRRKTLAEQCHCLLEQFLNDLTCKEGLEIWEMCTRTGPSVAGAWNKTLMSLSSAHGGEEAERKRDSSSILCSSFIVRKSNHC